MLKSSSFEKKAGKTSEKIAFLDPICIEKGSLWTTPKMKKNFFLVEITKADHQLSESFYFIKILYVLTELWIFFYLQWCFFSKKCHFQLKQLWPLRWYWPPGIFTWSFPNISKSQCPQLPATCVCLYFSAEAHCSVVTLLI